jgi:DNA-binding HxlR family transcriptional regulator
MVVRDLMLGPRRYSDLLNGLGGVGTDILAARLRGLQEAGIVGQTGSGRSRHYELTTSGKALRPVLVELARWGADRVRFPGDPSQVPPRVPLTALLIGATALPRQANGVYQLQVGDEAIRVQVAGGLVHAAPDCEPSATIALSMAGLRDLIIGAPVSEIERNGDVSIDGDRRRAAVLLSALSGPPLLDGLRSQLG